LVRNSRESAIEPAVADKWTVSDDGLTYTFHLRPGITFHNGGPVTPDDVIASLTRAKNNGSNKWMFAEVTSFDKVDDATVKIVLSKKVASFLARLAFNSNAVFPKAEVDKVGTSEFMKPIGTGPFMVQEWVVNDHLTLNKNPNYWQMGSDGKPLPYLDQLLFKQVAESTTQVLQVQAGSPNGSGGGPFTHGAKRAPRFRRTPTASETTIAAQATVAELMNGGCGATRTSATVRKSIPATTVSAAPVAIAARRRLAPVASCHPGSSTPGRRARTNPSAARPAAMTIAASAYTSNTLPYASMKPAPTRAAIAGSPRVRRRSRTQPLTPIPMTRNPSVRARASLNGTIGGRVVRNASIGRS